MTAEIQKHLNVSFEEAEHYKTAGEGNITNSTIAREVAALSDKVSQTLVTEILPWRWRRGSTRVLARRRCWPRRPGRARAVCCGLAL